MTTEHREPESEPLKFQLEAALKVLRHIEAERGRLPELIRRAIERADASEIFRLRREQQSLEDNWYSQKARVLQLEIQQKGQERRRLQAEVAFLVDLQEEAAKEAQQRADEARAALGKHNRATLEVSLAENRLDLLREEVNKLRGELQSISSEVMEAGGQAA